MLQHRRENLGQDSSVDSHLQKEKKQQQGFKDKDVLSSLSWTERMDGLSGIKEAVSVKAERLSLLRRRMGVQWDITCPHPTMLL